MDVCILKLRIHISATAAAAAVVTTAEAATKRFSPIFDATGLWLRRRNQNQCVLPLLA